MNLKNTPLIFTDQSCFDRVLVRLAAIVIVKRSMYLLSVARVPPTFLQESSVCKQERVSRDDAQTDDTNQAR
jgi:hypothetical protein